MFGKNKKQNNITGKDATQNEYDSEDYRPVLHCSICNGEQIAGFKNVRTGKFEEIMLIRNQTDLRKFMTKYGVEEITKEY